MEMYDTYQLRLKRSILDTVGRKARMTIES